MTLRATLRGIAALPPFMPLLRGYRHLRRLYRDARAPAATFSSIYHENLWGSRESRSGTGSTLEATAQIREFLPGLLRELRVRSLLDAPCGDFAWMRLVDLGVDEYVGADVVPDLVARLRRDFEAPGRRFVVADVTTDPLPRADAILCRQCLIHLSNRRVARALANFGRSEARWLLTTSFRGIPRNVDIETGSFRRLDLRIAPFGLGEPDRSLRDGDDEHARLDVYDLDRLRRAGILRA